MTAPWRGEKSTKSCEIPFCQWRTTENCKFGFIAKWSRNSFKTCKNSHTKLATLNFDEWYQKTDLWSNSVVPIKFHKKCQSQGEISHFFKLSVLAFFTLSMTYRFRVLPGLKGVSTFEFALVRNDLICKNFCELLNFSELCPCLNFFLKKTNNVDVSQKVLACSKPFLEFPETKIFCTHFQGDFNLVDFFPFCP